MSRYTPVADAPFSIFGYVCTKCSRDAVGAFVPAVVVVDLDALDGYMGKALCAEHYAAALAEREATR